MTDKSEFTVSYNAGVPTWSRYPYGCATTSSPCPQPWSHRPLSFIHRSHRHRSFPLRYFTPDLSQFLTPRSVAPHSPCAPSRPMLSPPSVLAPPVHEYSCASTVASAHDWPPRACLPILIPPPVPHTAPSLFLVRAAFLICAFPLIRVLFRM